MKHALWSLAGALLLVAGLVAFADAGRKRLTSPVSVGLREGTPAPELTNTSWLNADHPLRLKELRGRVVLRIRQLLAE